MAPIAILATGGHGIPSPGSLNDPSQALAVIKASPDLAIVTTVMCATGAAQVFVVLALADLFGGSPARWTRVSEVFGIIAAAFLMIDGALGMAALPQLARCGRGTGRPLIEQIALTPRSTRRQTFIITPATCAGPSMANCLLRCAPR